MHLLRLRQAFCRDLARLPNEQQIQRKAAAEMIAVIDRALQAKKATDALCRMVG